MNRNSKTAKENKKNNPFMKKDGVPRVFVASGKDPYENTRKVLAQIDLSPASGKKVLLKPNAGRIAVPGQGITTNPQVVAAAIDAFKDAGAQVAVGESPIRGVNALDALEATGIAAVARARNCPLIDMDKHPCVKKAIPHGVVLETLELCREVTEYDLIVSIPVMKTHMHTGVSLSVKNMKGCLWRHSKVKLHMLPPVKGTNERSLNIAIADMASILLPHLSIIDGSVGMQGLGPSAGEPKQMGVVLAGADAFAVDAVACALMGIRAEEIPYLKIAADRGYGVINMNNIKVSPDNWKEWTSGFDLPPENLSIQFPNIRILDEKSCSACQSTLFLFLKKYGNSIFDYFPSNVCLNIAIGKGHADVPEGTLCIGNCTSAHQKRGVFVKGCPPVGSEIFNAISRKALKPSIRHKNLSKKQKAK